MNKRPPLQKRLPLRTRLTLWYLLTLTTILILFLGFLYWQVQRSLLAQMDSALRLAATQALISVESQGQGPTFQDTANMNGLSRRLSDDFAIYLLAPDGAVTDSMGRRDEFTAQMPQPGLTTVPHEDDRWRVYSERIGPVRGASGSPGGWIQVAQEMDPVTETLASLRTQMLLGLPLALLLAGVGGFFLAGRALRPIDHIAHIAQTINAGDLSRRIDYDGPADEVGRLAATFDRMLERLQAAFVRERRFTADAAHELRTPLTALKGRIEVTLNRPRKAQEYTEVLREMEQQVDRLIRLSNDLLFMARLDQEEPATRQEPVELDELLAALLNQVQALADRKQATLASSLQPGLTVRGNLDLLIRLFLNLLDNAIKYTPAGGQVKISAHADEGDIVVAVTDTGPGIPADHLPHLFDRFYRVQGDRSRQGQQDGGGAGLGLSIAAEIARMHHGRIDVESDMGQGTTFTVHLPGTIQNNP